MEEEEFRRLLDLFPVVRPRDFFFDLEASTHSTSRPTPSHDKALMEWQDAWGEEEEAEKDEIRTRDIDLHDAFWEKLRLEAEKKMGAEEAKRICRAFQQVHRKLVYEELSSDAAHSFIYSSKCSGE